MIDAVKLNRLLDKVQLREVVDLTQELQEIRTLLEYKDSVRDSMSTKEIKKAAKSNESNVNFITNVVDEHQAGAVEGACGQMTSR